MRHKRTSADVRPKSMHLVCGYETDVNSLASPPDVSAGWNTVVSYKRKNKVSKMIAPKIVEGERGCVTSVAPLVSGSVNNSAKTLSALAGGAGSDRCDPVKKKKGRKPRRCFISRRLSQSL